MNKIFRIVWNEAAQAWVAVSELTKKHKKRASVTAVAAALVAGMLSPFAQATEGASSGENEHENVAPDKLKTDYYFRVTTTNTGETSDGGNTYTTCPDGNV
ncbi:ESPR domain-containing protein [Haemophilus haemolyticus]|uniref:ESPR domain-containing protein n=1 Tax=Haemophilus haemolyticus TaxID=726 RepID=UPI000E58699E|nr:ESPR domain-containing protein [Haemophilus haemolyticus]